MESNYFFNYKLTYYDEYDSKEKEVSGLVTGSSASDCIQKLIDCYGADNIINLSFNTTNFSEPLEFKDGAAAEDFLFRFFNESY